MKKCLLISSCLMFFVACSTPFNSGIGGDTEMNTITGDDEQALCDAMQTEAEAEGIPEVSKKFGCYIAGVFAAGFSMEDDTEAVCQEAVDECLAAEAEEEEASDSCDLNMGDCTAPLSDFEACVRAGWEELKTIVDDLTCSEADSDEDEDVDDTCTSSEACKALYDACPEFDPCSDA